MSSFEDFVQTELPLRPYVPTDGNAEAVAIRRGAGPRQMQFIDLQDGQFLGKINGELKGIPITTRHVVFDVALGSPATSWSIEHNFNSFNCTIQVYQLLANGSYQSISPNTINLLDANTISIGFLQPMAGKAIIAFVD